MTVCVAVISSDGSAAIGASDRMVSTADNQTKRLKVHHLTAQVVAMIAGDVELHTELLIETRAMISDAKDMPELLTVKNIADSYALAFLEAKKRRAERRFLAPLGLTAESFASNQRKMEDKIAAEITREIINFQMPHCSAIFMGIDASQGYQRAHIYTVENGHLACHDETGFVAIGVGMYQATSSLMFGGHHAEMHLDPAVYLTLAAKKRAEVTPGVGKETDMVVVTVADGGYILFREDVVDQLEKIYERAEREHGRINHIATTECHELFEPFRTAPSIESVTSQKVELSGTAPAANESAAARVGESGSPTSAPGVQQDAGRDSQKEAIKGS
ncbi:hypothetical protein [Ottowia sp. VDI28]|uniref:hypothetical protein n=1 Tax=Ottowia sp. VDI28 TaxID=3133968 RepID=UPI003C2DEA1B